MSHRQYTQLDKFIIDFDTAFAAIFTDKSAISRLNPAQKDAKSSLNTKEKRVSQGLMRVNHAGEVSAQALYHGQSLTARSSSVQKSMQRAAEEEVDHLNWCKERLDELDTHSSYLNPLWYFGSFSIGALAGVLGDKWSLGFVAETEHQVVEHLRSHLRKLPSQDDKSRAILEQMKTDEAQHAAMALESGAAELPARIKKLMKLCSLVMTTTAYWL
jgi:ubiquinone biosynthesis monooxygenase Coq7